MGQQASTAGGNLVLYQAPTGAAAVLSSIVACNTGASATTIRVHFREEAAAAAAANALVYDLDIAAKETIVLVLGITCDAADAVAVQAAATGVTFTAFGTEIT